MEEIYKIKNGYNHKKNNPDKLSTLDIQKSLIKIENFDKKLKKNAELKTVTLPHKEKQETTLKEKIKSKSLFYYQVKNLENLHYLGNSYLEDIKNNITRFAFCAVSERHEQQKTILGLVAFLRYLTNEKLIIVTDVFHQSFYYDFMLKNNLLSNPLVDEFGNKEYEIDSNTAIIELYHTNTTLINSLSNSVWLVDIPSINNINRQKQLLVPFIENVDNVSLTLLMENAKNNKIKEAVKYFKSYKVKTKGFIT